jgi:hypothetical protein
MEEGAYAREHVAFPPGIDGRYRSVPRCDKEQRGTRKANTQYPKDCPLGQRSYKQVLVENRLVNRHIIMKQRSGDHRGHQYHELRQ